MTSSKEHTLPSRAAVAVGYWRRCLSDWAAAFVAELRATDDAERGRAASLLSPVRALALVLVEEVSLLHAEVNAMVWRRRDGWRAVPDEAKQLPRGHLLQDLLAVGDATRAFAERAPHAWRLLPSCEEFGVFGTHLRAVADLLQPAAVGSSSS